MTVRPYRCGPEFLLVLLIACLACLGRASGQTVRVPQDQPTIQAGINAAVNGGTVLVSQGTYTENIDFLGKNIVVTSGAANSAGAASTIIQGAAAGPVVTFQTGEPVTATLNGFTITQTNAAGNAIAGDAIAIANASATIANNVITGIATCSISAHSTTISPTNSVVITGNTIGNSTIGGAGGSCGTSKSPIGGGANIYLYEIASVTMNNNLISNIQEAAGSKLTGNISTQNVTNFVFQENIVSGNYTDSESSLFVSICPIVTVVNNLFVGNLLGVGGTATLSIDAGSVGATVQRTVVNNTFSGNSFMSRLGDATDFELGVLYGTGSIANNIFTSASYTPVACTISPAGTSYTFEHNDVFVPGTPQSYTCSSTPAQTFANISADPQFISPSTSNFQTAALSPVVAAGDITAPQIPATDLRGKNREVCGTIDMGAYEVHPNPPIVLTSTPNPSIGTLPATLTATLTGNCNVPTGVVTFFDGTTPIGTAILNGAAQATFSTSALTVGTHNISATYAGDFNFDNSTSNTVVQVVTGFPTATALQVSPNPANALQPITFSAVVSSTFGTPNGTVTFYSGTTALGTAMLNTSGAASLTLSNLNAGTFAITAVFNATVSYAQSTSPVVTEIVNAYPSTTSLTSSPNPSFYGQAVTFIATVAAPSSPVSPTGTVTFMQGTATLGTATLSAGGIANFTTSALAVGSDTVTAVYGGSVDDHSSTSNSVVQVVGLANTSLSLSGSPNPAYVGQTVTLTAALTSTYSGSSPSGTVVFADQFGTLGSAQLTNGQAIFTSSSLTQGTHNMTASFAGGGSFSPAVSTTLAEVVNPSLFTITPSQPILTLKAGAQGSINIVGSTIGVYTGTPTLSAGTPPTYMTLAFKPTTLPLTPGAAASSVLTIVTSNAPNGVALDRPRFESGAVYAVYCSLILPFVRRRRIGRLFAIAVASAALLLCATGCETIAYQVSTVAPGTYIIPIRAADTAGNVAATDLTVVITQ